MCSYEKAPYVEYEYLKIVSLFFSHFIVHILGYFIPVKII